MGFSIWSNACSVTVHDVTRTGTTRALPHTNSTTGRLSGLREAVPRPAACVLLRTSLLLGYINSSSAASAGWMPRSSAIRRSEEHTSELQSRENLVCRLLLEK